MNKKDLENAYQIAKELYDWEDVWDIYDVRRLYSNLAEELDLNIEFWVDGCQYGGDEEIYCYIHINNIWSVVFNRSCITFCDHERYKDAVDYILQLEEEGEKIKEKLERD